MRKFVYVACTAAAIGGGAMTAASGYAAEPIKSTPTELMTTPLAGDPSREVKVINVALPPGSDSGRHYHYGDQYTTVQEGEIHIAVEGKGDHVLKAGDALHIDPMVVHRTQNMSGKPARTTELFIVAKGKRLSEKSE